MPARPGLSPGQNSSGLLPHTLHVNASKVVGERRLQTQRRHMELHPILRRFTAHLQDIMHRNIHLGKTKMVFLTRDSERKRQNIDETSLQQQRVEEARTTSFLEDHNTRKRSDKRECVL